VVKGGRFHFKGFPGFTPNLSPEEVLRLGSFGGYYFRAIASGVTGRVHVDAWRELPPAWLAGLDVARQVASAEYRPAANSFRVGSGLDLREWEKSGWIDAQDPFGWSVLVFFPETMRRPPSPHSPRPRPRPCPSRPGLAGSSGTAASSWGAARTTTRAR
jgi:hypothetical protein